MKKNNILMVAASQLSWLLSKTECGEALNWLLTVLEETKLRKERRRVKESERSCRERGQK